MTSPLLLAPGGGSKFAADAEQCREQRSLEQGTPVIVDLVFKARIARGIGARLTLQDNRATVRHDQTGPDQQDAGLQSRYASSAKAARPPTPREEFLDAVARSHPGRRSPLPV